ncbi:MAG: ABC-F family ATP-binding cassette domain-containing protein [Rhabdochlamydiaceae bacterium]|nr:ABC-F family ATP-binding cassette domain-containing protein [Candidatus Amphrikana amoebophyrae]
MSLLLNCKSLEKAYGSQVLFENLSFSIFAGDRIGLIGPNGAGKSTLLKILASEESSDGGEVCPKRDLRIGYVPQSAEYEDESPLNVLLDTLHSETHLSEHEKLNLVETWLTKLGFRGDEKSAALLSGGWKKRLSIAIAMLNNPDVLMLDEPTNHLDLESIVWLEKFLDKEIKTYIVVSHDRSFLSKATSRIVEINPLYPEGLFSVDGPYPFFLEKKERFIEGQIEQERSIATKVRRETEWLRSTPKARTTKAQSRIDQAKELFDEHSALKMRNKKQRAEISFVGSERQTKKLLVAKNLKLSLGDKLLFENLDISLTSGLRLGLMGPNGCGKTSLLKLFAQELEPDMGTIKRADDLKIVYFDQHRTKLDENITLKEALAPAGEFVHYRGQAIHVNGWCQRFLFPREYLGMSVNKLSGGERARISIARLMLEPADILLLDEPTNDLDIPTLETLEDNLSDFPGAVVLITHDRSMLENMCTQFLALGEPSKCKTYAQYSDWESSRSIKPTTIKKKESKPQESREVRKERNRLEKAIEKRETQVVELEKLMKGQDLSKLQDIHTQIEEVRKEIDQLFEKWVTLS